MHQFDPQLDLLLERTIEIPPKDGLGGIDDTRASQALVYACTVANLLIVKSTFLLAGFSAR
jgi:hypothetical protein